MSSSTEALSIAAIDSNTVISSNTQTPLPNVPTIKSFSLDCIFISETGTEGNSLNFRQLFPPLKLTNKPLSVPINTKLFLAGNTHQAYPIP